MTPSADLERLLTTAHLLADAARPIALRYFRAADIGTEAKGDGGFDPVTRADREIEREMRRLLAQHQPEDGILGEEEAPQPGTSGRTWVLDPIDGTRAFMCGLPSWGVLIALNDGERPILGVMDQPFTGERFIGVNAHEKCVSERISAHSSQKLSTRRNATLATAIACSTTPEMFNAGGEQSGFDKISKAVRMMRLGTDCYGYAMLAMGQVDLVIEASLKPFDIQALMPLVQAAGGVVTDWQGGDAQNGGRVIASATPALHDEALARLATIL